MIVEPEGLSMNKAEKTRELMKHCLFKDTELVDGKPPENAVIVEGIVNRFGFHPGRIAEKKDEIKELLDEMPASFHIGGGGGMSFLNLCMDKHDNHWAEHQTMGDLVCLGIAAGMAKYCLPRDMWNMFPGGMPYVQFNTGQ